MTRALSLLAVEPLPEVAVILFAEWFSGLDPITHDALTRHAVLGPGDTLEKVGVRHGCTREWVRQREIAGKRDVLATLRALDSAWVDQLFTSLTLAKLVNLSFLAGLFGGREHGAATALVVLSHLAWRPTAQSQGWFCSDSDWVQTQFTVLSSNGPLEADEWESLVASSALPLEFVDESEIPNVGQWVPYLGCRIRSRHLRHDRAAVLIGQSGPMTAQEIAERTGDPSWRGLGNLLGRSSTFVRIPKQGWALASSIERPIYNSTLPAVIDTLRAHGPLTRLELVQEVQVLHDVTRWRIEQCLDNFQIGFVPDGRVWLVEFGATRPIELEPTRPESMVSVGDAVGLRFSITSDHVRGSGTPLHTWLCWRLGLRSSPEICHFGPPGAPFEETVSVTRQGGQAGLGSIRTILEKLNLLEGCEVALVLHTDSRTWSITHGCHPSQCPARSVHVS